MFGAVRVANKRRGPAPKAPAIQVNVCCQTLGVTHRHDCAVAPFKRRGPGPFLPTYAPRDLHRCCDKLGVHAYDCPKAPPERRAPQPFVVERPLR